MSVYIVMYCDEPNNTPEIEIVFDSYEKAEKFIENELKEFEGFEGRFFIEEYDVL